MISFGNVGQGHDWMRSLTPNPDQHLKQGWYLEHEGERVKVVGFNERGWVRLAEPLKQTHGSGGWKVIPPPPPPPAQVKVGALAAQLLARIDAAIEANPRPNCPICGSQMVFEQNGERSFWSCLSFPDCRGYRTPTPQEFDRNYIPPMPYTAADFAKLGQEDYDPIDDF